MNVTASFHVHRGPHVPQPIYTRLISLCMHHRYAEPVGKNDGSLSNGVRLFSCPPDHGHVVRPDKVSLSRSDKQQPRPCKPAQHEEEKTKKNAPSCKDPAACTPACMNISPAASRRSTSSTPSPNAMSAVTPEGQRSIFNPDRLEYGDPDTVMGSHQSVADTLPRNRVGLVFDDRMCAHRAPTYHPEQPDRIKAIFCRLEQQGLAQRCVRIHARSASSTELGLVHSDSHVQRMLGLKDLPQDELDRIAQELDSVYLCPESSSAALLAAGSVIEATKRVCTGVIKRAACVVS
jgi:hypothetical protein